MADELARAEVWRQTNFSPVGDALGEALDEGARERLGDLRRAWVAWYRANGTIERAHTRGVYLAPPKGGSRLPTLVVYVDSRMRAVDFSANRETYQARLEEQGLAVGRLEFRQSRERGAAASRDVVRRESPAASEDGLPELSREELELVDERCAGLVEPLRARVREAMTWSLRREKKETQK